jgi:hypothetical protein
MATTVSTEKIGSSIYIKSHDHDPGLTTAILVSPDGGTTIRYLDMKDYTNFSANFAPSVGTGGITLAEIVASSIDTFASVTQIKTSGAVAADAVQDNVFLECSAEEIVHTAAGLRYVAGRVTMPTSTDEAKVTYVALPIRKFTGLTATSIT